MPYDKATWLKWISEIQAIAQNGLAYTTNIYDIERYYRLRELAAELAANVSNLSPEEISGFFSLEKGYATPKLDIRAFCLKDNKLLLVRERLDNLWSLPGGWADVNESPSEAVVRETEEETGFKIKPLKLLALWDKLKHAHPLEWPHAYKCFFHCQIIGGEINQNHEITEVGFFSFDALPSLSTTRVTLKQLTTLYELVLHPKETVFD